jgi:hypothetical protein
MSVTVALLLAAQASFGAEPTDPHAAAAPIIAASTALAALPARQSLGSAGPINRYAFDIANFSVTDAGSSVECRYPGNLRYRCNYVAETVTIPSALRRIVVDVPDLDRGKRVTIRFANEHGANEKSLEIANPPQVIHEIESLALPAGGETTVGPTGKRVPVTTLQTITASTAPALTVLMPYEPSRCDQLYAQWAGATATDPVFTSAFGALNGAVAPVKPVAPGSPVREDNLPQWLITYPASATRMQFIAHYEVTYRVGLCADRVLR